MINQTPKGKMEDMSKRNKPPQRLQLEPRRSALMQDKHMSLELVRMLPSVASSLEAQHIQDLHRSLQAMDTQAHSKVNNHPTACRNSLNTVMRTTRASLLSLRTDNRSTERRREDMSRHKQHIQHQVSKGCSRQRRGSSR
jgi:hypothetical protein